MRHTWLALWAIGLSVAAHGAAYAQEAEGEQHHDEAGDSERDAKRGKGPAAPKGEAHADPRVRKAPAEAVAANNPSDATETNCSDRIDEDGDSVTDCADSDCIDSPACKTTGVHEQTDAL